MEQISLTRGVQSGVGVVALHGVVNQTGNLLNMDPYISTAPMKIGHTKVDGTFRRRFGNVVNQKNTEFDFPRGAPGVYALSKSGTEGKGNLADGAFLQGGHDYAFTAAADLLEAQGIVQREVHMETHFGKPEHFKYVDRTKEELTERLIDMGQDYQRDRINDLLNKGFSAEEIKAKLDREREKAIDKAEKMPFNQSALLQAKIAKMIPSELTQDFSNYASPGGIPTARDTSAFQRAVDAGSTVNRAKKYQAMNREARIAGQITQIEEPVKLVDQEMIETQRDIVDRVAREHASEKAKIQDLRQRDIEEQKRVEAKTLQREDQVAKAMGISPSTMKEKVTFKISDFPEKEQVKLRQGRGRPRKITGKITSLEDIEEIAQKEQQNLFNLLPGLMKTRASAGLTNQEAVDVELAARPKKGKKRE